MNKFFNDNFGIIVDDNTLIRKTIIEFIKDENKIVEYDSGESLTTDLKKGNLNPDWILLDIKMNGISGFETADILREINPNWRIGFISNYDIPAYLRKAESLGAKLFISKNNLSMLREKLK